MWGQVEKRKGNLARPSTRDGPARRMRPDRRRYRNPVSFNEPPGQHDRRFQTDDPGLSPQSASPQGNWGTASGSTRAHSDGFQQLGSKPGTVQPSTNLHPMITQPLGRSWDTRVPLGPAMPADMVWRLDHIKESAAEPQIRLGSGLGFESTRPSSRGPGIIFQRLVVLRGRHGF